MLSQTTDPQTLQSQTWPIDRFVFYARNPRKNDSAVDRICGSIREFGFKVPVLARSDGEVVDGHLRLKAARKLGSWPGGDAPAADAGGRAGGRRGGGEGGEGGGGAPRGAQVLPGVYTVKMAVGTTAVDRKVTVGIDPELKSTPADLQAQWSALMKINDMIRGTGDMLRESDRHTDSPAWTKFRASLTATGLAQQLQSLFTLIDGANDTPTEAMRKLLDDLASDYERSATEFRALK